MTLAKKYWWLFCVTAAAVVANFGVALKLGIQQPVESDAYYYQQLAQSVAAGEGYRVRDGFWPDAPSMRRMPAWPLVVAGVYAMGGESSPNVTMRLLALSLNVLVALLVATLTWRLYGNRFMAALAGGLYVIHPMALMSSYDCLSEPLFLALSLAGLLLLLSSGWKVRWGGALLLGLAVLTRANFVLWGLGAALLLLVWACWSRQTSRQAVVSGLCGLVLFLLPISIWSVRNYRVCGHFPVLSTLRGQTYYGGNNSVVADELAYWGYWVFPDRIPGETPMRELAQGQGMSEYEVDEYYYAKGQAFVRGHAQAMPRLWLGKLLRAYGPVPWNPSLPGYAQGAFRFGIFLLSLIGCCLAWRRTHAVFLLSLLAMAGVNVLTVVVFWGCARFSFALEPFLLPLAAVALEALLSFPRLRVFAHGSYSAAQGRGRERG